MIIDIRVSPTWHDLASHHQDTSNIHASPRSFLQHTTSEECFQADSSHAIPSIWGCSLHARCSILYLRPVYQCKTDEILKAEVGETAGPTQIHQVICLECFKSLMKNKQNASGARMSRLLNIITTVSYMDHLHNVCLLFVQDQSRGHGYMILSWTSDNTSGALE